MMSGQTNQQTDSNQNPSAMGAQNDQHSSATPLLAGLSPKAADPTGAKQDTQIHLIDSTQKNISSKTDPQMYKLQQQQKQSSSPSHYQQQANNNNNNSQKQPIQYSEMKTFNGLPKADSRAITINGPKVIGKKDPEEQQQPLQPPQQQQQSQAARGDDNNNFNIEVKKESNFMVALKLFAIFSTIYFFMWSSSLLSQAFNLASYHYAGHFIRTSGFLQNPLIGLMVGVITTVVFQSSGAVTSVLVTIVGSGVLTVRQSIPIIMGANLGTSVTNTVVSLIVYRSKQNFEIAMTAGIVHDMYNMMSVVFLLPIELLLHPLEHGSMWMMNWFGKDSHTEIGELQFLSYLVRPLVEAVILIDTSKTSNLNSTVIVPADESLVKKCCNEERIGNMTKCHLKCSSLFSNIDLSDNVICILLLIIAMVTLFTCLIFVVKVTKSLLG